MKIIENLYVVPGVVANPYVIADEDGLTIIDAGIPGSHRKILAYVEGLGKSPTDVKRIILTHSDMDHVGGLAALQAATGARTYTSQIEADAIARGKPSRPIQAQGFSWRRTLMRLLAPIIGPRPFKVDEILKDGQTLPVLGGLRVVETIGHTPGHISLYAPAAGVLFCGDSMRTNESGPILATPAALTWDADKAKESMRKQAALGARILCPGHGPVLRDAAAKITVP